MSYFLRLGISCCFDMTRKFLKREDYARWFFDFVIWHPSWSVSYQTFSLCATIYFVSLDCYGPFHTVDNGLMLISWLLVLVKLKFILKAEHVIFFTKVIWSKSEFCRDWCDLLWRDILPFTIDVRVVVSSSAFVCPSTRTNWSLDVWVGRDPGPWLSADLHT